MAAVNLRYLDHRDPFLQKDSLGFLGCSRFEQSLQDLVAFGQKQLAKRVGNQIGQGRLRRVSDTTSQIFVRKTHTMNLGSVPCF